MGIKPGKWLRGTGWFRNRNRESGGKFWMTSARKMSGGCQMPSKGDWEKELREGEEMVQGGTRGQESFSMTCRCENK